MGRRKSVINIPKNAKIKCPHCGVVRLRKIPLDGSPQYFDCDKCNNRVQTPVTGCCIICAFTNKKCVPTLLMEARAKNLEVKGLE
ncbi:MAG: GDCCVxC domain-containing (seleno)protein [Nanoarchaeota archaeon]